MGTWGCGISSNDTYADIFGQFLDLYDAGMSPTEITQRLIQENRETIGIYEDAPNFWYAIARAQWECKALQQDVLRKVESFIQTKEDLRIWETLGATKADLRGREKALEKFIAKLRSEKKNPRIRRKKRYFDSLFKKGDCLIYKMDNGNYGGAFVLTQEQQTESGTNYIAITTIDSEPKPVLKDFETAKVYVRRAEEYRFEGPGGLIVEIVDQPQIGGFYASSFDSNEIEIEVIGNLPIRRKYEITRIVGYGWHVLRSFVPSNDEYERENGKPTSQLFLTEWTKTRWRLPLTHFFKT